MEKINKNEWDKWGRWVQPVISGGFWPSWTRSSTLKKIFPRIPNKPILFLDGHTFFPMKTIKFFDNLVINLFKENSFRDINLRIESECTRSEEDILSLLKEDPGSIDTLDYIERLFRAYQEMVGPWVSCTMLSNSIEKYLLNNKIVGSEEEMFKKIKPFWKHTWIEEQSKDAETILNLILKKHPELKIEKLSTEVIGDLPEINNLLEEHVKRFLWFGTHHWVGNSYTKESLIDDLKSIHKKSKPIEKSQSSEDEKSDLWELLANCIYWRTHSAETTASVVFSSRKFLNKLSDGWNITYEQLTWLSNKEIIEFARKDLSTIDMPENYEERRDGYGIFDIGNDRHKIVVGTELKKLLNQVLEELPREVSEISGITASRGDAVRGIVKVLISPEDVNKLEDGDILVAPETAPDYVPIMKKASAIVTEAGGITSHAAIVSRELGKPCIIGTKIATQVLRDGDYVEVDANKGIVRILEQKTNSSQQED